MATPSRVIAGRHRGPNVEIMFYTGILVTRKYLNSQKISDEITGVYRVISRSALQTPGVEDASNLLG